MSPPLMGLRLASIQATSYSYPTKLEQSVSTTVMARQMRRRLPHLSPTSSPHSNRSDAQLSRQRGAEQGGGGQRLLRVRRLFVFANCKSFVAGEAAFTAAVPHLIVIPHDTCMLLQDPRSSPRRGLPRQKTTKMRPLRRSHAFRPFR